jgi:hypothetical protein
MAVRYLLLFLGTEIHACRQPRILPSGKDLPFLPRRSSPTEQPAILPVSQSMSEQFCALNALMTYARITRQVHDWTPAVQPFCHSDIVQRAEFSSPHRRHFRHYGSIKGCRHRRPAVHGNQSNHCLQQNRVVTAGTVSLCCKDVPRKIGRTVTIRRAARPHGMQTIDPPIIWRHAYVRVVLQAMTASSCQ